MYVWMPILCMFLIDWKSFTRKTFDISLQTTLIFYHFNYMFNMTNSAGECNIAKEYIYVCVFYVKLHIIFMCSHAADARRRVSVGTCILISFSACSTQTTAMCIIKRHCHTVVVCRAGATTKVYGWFLYNWFPTSYLCLRERRRVRERFKFAVQMKWVSFTQCSILTNARLILHIINNKVAPIYAQKWYFLERICVEELWHLHFIHLRNFNLFCHPQIHVCVRLYALFPLVYLFASLADGAPPCGVRPQPYWSFMAHIGWHCSKHLFLI